MEQQKKPEIDWHMVYSYLGLDMDVYEKINKGDNFCSTMILKAEYEPDDS